MTPGKATPRLCSTTLACLLLFSSLPVPTGAQTREVRIAAAADLKFAMQDLVAEFEKATGITFEVTYGSSGNFFSQLQSGAPFDLFFSADAEYPRKLEAAGLAEPGTLYTYAFGRLAIWTPADTKLDLARKGWDSLLDRNVQRISIANPEHAPYGRAALAALRKAGIYDRVKTKLIFGEDVSQAAQFVQSGNAQAGILAMSFAISPAMKAGKLWEIPPNGYPPIEQAAVVMKSSPNKDVAKRFLDFVKSASANYILIKDGFSPPGSGTPGMALR